MVGRQFLQTFPPFTHSQRARFPHLCLAVHVQHGSFGLTLASASIKSNSSVTDLTISVTSGDRLLTFKGASHASRSAPFPTVGPSVAEPSSIHPEGLVASDPE